MTERRVGILGGTFDPVHCGHLDVARAAESTLALTSILLVPSSTPPHRPAPAASSYHRFAMAALAIVGEARWRASDMELIAPAPSYTVATLERFHEAGYSADELFFLVGADAFLEIATWKDYPRVLDRAHFAVVSRVGLPAADLPHRLPDLADRMALGGAAARTGNRPLIFLIDAVTTDVSSTAIRRRRADRQSIAGLVPPLVQQYIGSTAFTRYQTPQSTSREQARRKRQAVA